MSLIIAEPVLLQKHLEEAKPLPLPQQVLMVKPTYFSVDYVINPHMEGNIGSVDQAKALWQWEVLGQKFKQFGLSVKVIDGVPGLPDMVFSANQSFPFIDKEGNKQTVMGIMSSDKRKEEVPYFEQWYRQNGYEINYLDATQISSFEGMGDAVWHFKKRLLWAGYGYRSTKEAFETISERFDLPIVLLRLTNPKFYHLDTCFSILNNETVLIYPPAFTSEGLELIQAAFTNVIEAPPDEAETQLACNALSPDGKGVIIQAGCEEVNRNIKKCGLGFHEVETSEFLKSGGSVTCMKLLFW